MSENGNEYRTEDKHDNFTMLPNLIDDLDLSAGAFRLYVHIRRRTGEEGVCFEKAGNLAKYCNLSRRSVATFKAELVKGGLIRISKKRGKHGEFPSDVITVTDLWTANHNYFANTNGDQRSELVLGDARHELNDSVARFRPDAK